MPAANSVIVPTAYQASAFAFGRAYTAFARTMQRWYGGGAKDATSTSVPGMNMIPVRGRRGVRMLPIGGGVASVTIGGGGGAAYGGGSNVTAAAPTTPGGVTATFAAGFTGGVLTSVTVINPGSGYTAPPALTVNAVGGGAGATATASMQIGWIGPNPNTGA